MINPFRATGHFLYPLKALRNQRFSDIFRGYREKQVASYGLIHLNHQLTSGEDKEATTSIW